MKLFIGTIILVLLCACSVSSEAPEESNCPPLSNEAPADLLVNTLYEVRSPGSSHQFAAPAFSTVLVEVDSPSYLLFNATLLATGDAIPRESVAYAEGDPTEFTFTGDMTENGGGGLRFEFITENECDSFEFVLRITP